MKVADITAYWSLPKDKPGSLEFRILNFKKGDGELDDVLRRSAIVREEARAMFGTQLVSLRMYATEDEQDHCSDVLSVIASVLETEEEWQERIASSRISREAKTKRSIENAIALLREKNILPGPTFENRLYEPENLAWVMRNIGPPEIYDYAEKFIGERDQRDVFRDFFKWKSFDRYTLGDLCELIAYLEFEPNSFLEVELDELRTYFKSINFDSERIKSASDKTFGALVIGSYMATNGFDEILVLSEA